MSRKARAWRTGSVSPRIRAASSVLGTKTSVCGQDRAERLEVVARPGRGDVEDGDRARPSGPGRTARPGRRRRARAGSGSSRCRGRAGAGRGPRRGRPAAKPRFAPKEWMNRRSSPLTLTIRVWLVARAGRSSGAATSTPCATSVSVANRPKTSSPTLPQIDDADAQPRQVHRRVGRAAADVQDQLVDRDQLARARAGGRSAVQRWSATTIPAQTTGDAGVRRCGGLDTVEIPAGRASRRRAIRAGHPRSQPTTPNRHGQPTSPAVDVRSGCRSRRRPRRREPCDGRLVVDARRACRSAPRSRRR